MNTIILRFALAIGCMSVNMTKVNFSLERCLSISVHSSWLVNLFKLLGDCRPKIISWKLSKWKISKEWQFGKNQCVLRNIWPKRGSPTQGKMGRQMCRVLLSPSYVPQKRQWRGKRSTLCPDPIPLYIPCTVYSRRGKKGSGFKWSQKEWILLDQPLVNIMGFWGTGMFP